MKKVLQILIGGFTFTGVASYLYQQYVHVDRKHVQYDFLFCRNNVMTMIMNDDIFEKSKFTALGAVGKNGSSMDYVKLYKELKRYLENNYYDTIVINTSVVPVIITCMLAARNSKALIIPHAHNTGIVVDKNSLRNKYRFIIQPIEQILRCYIRKKSSYLFACSNDAAISTFGIKSVEMEKLRIINNAINLEKFVFNAELRSQIRLEEGVSDSTIVYGNVGKLSERKNQRLLVHIFAEIYKKRPDSQLWLIGDGEQREELKALISELGLNDSVKLIGQRTDVNVIMQGMDSFVFTTLSEGLGIVAIEAQASGLPTTISDGVPDDVMITELIQKIPLSEDALTWAEKILEHDSKFTIRRDYSEKLKDAGYDIEYEACKITDFYCNI